MHLSHHRADEQGLTGLATVPSLLVSMWETREDLSPWLTLFQWKYVLDIPRVTDYLAEAWLDSNSYLGYCSNRWLLWTVSQLLGGVFMSFYSKSNSYLCFLVRCWTETLCMVEAKRNLRQNERRKDWEQSAIILWWLQNTGNTLEIQALFDT